jgi:hypothetical protein
VSWRWKTLHVMWMIKLLAHRLWPTCFTRIRSQGAEHGCGSSKKPMAKGFTKHKELCQFFFHDTWWGGYHGENGRNLWLPRLEPNLLGRLEPKSIDASMQVGIRRENGALTVESILRCHELGAGAVIDDHESRWGLCAHSSGHDFQRSMFCGIRSLPWITEIAESDHSL